MSTTEKATEKTTEKTAAVANTTEKSKKVVLQETVNEQVVYIGPTIPGIIVANTILSNGITKELADAKNEVPAIGTLIVPIRKLAYARKRLELRDTPESICYEKVLKYLTEKKGE